MGGPAHALQAAAAIAVHHQLLARVQRSCNGFLRFPFLPFLGPVLSLLLGKEHQIRAALDVLAPPLTSGFSLFISPSASTSPPEHHHKRYVLRGSIILTVA
jgi:hypothetical protein